MLYVPYRIDEDIFRDQYSTWNNAYIPLQEVVKQNEQTLHMKQLQHGVILIMQQMTLRK